MTTNQQLELGFNGSQTGIPGHRREQRVARAKWWFAQMRAVVAQAMDWQSEARPRPEQTWMPGAHRQVEL